MGTEVSAAEQTAEVVIEEIKETENVVKGAEESSSQLKDLEGKEVEEKVKEDLGIAEASSTVSEEAPENEKGDAVVKDVKKEEDLKASNSEFLASATDGKGESIGQESDTRAVEPAIEVHKKELNEQIDVANIPEPPTEEIGKSTEDSEEPSVKVSESEEAKEPATSAVSEEENSKESEVAEDPAISAVSEEENIKEAEVAEEPATSAVSEEENPKESEAAEEPAISAVSEEEKPKVSEAVEEPAAEPAISEAVSEEDKLPAVEKPTEETTVVCSVSETEDKSEPTIAPTDTEPNINTTTTPDASETAETSQVDAISTEENEVRPESSKEEPQLTDLSNEEISDKLPEVAVSENSDPVPVEALPLNEVTEIGDATLTSQEVSDVSEKKDSDQHSSGFVEESVKEENVSAVTDSSPVTEIVEGLTKQEDMVEEEMQEKVAVVGEPTLSGATQTEDATEVSQVVSEGSGGVEKVSEKMDETPGPSGSLDAPTDVSRVEGEKASGGVEVAEGKNDSVEVDSTTLVQTSRDLDVEEGKDKDTTSDLEDSEGKKDETEKAADQNTVESAKDGGDITKEATAETPQRQSHSIFSKVKQSIVKVKKAIIGKSPSPKSTTSEGNDDIKVK
ncbi:uncharacterized protein M6B38_281430 [Iris pallida]|uniref:Uncharacterized protein n=1 Tax=Iris pallida TaxID=29817 RepID=A0AAX6I272_IRIPA|nr:uncharacterized protein M6B38_281430 [Iris pallida]